MHTHQTPNSSIREWNLAFSTQYFGSICMGRTKCHLLFQFQIGRKSACFPLKRSSPQAHILNTPTYTKCQRPSINFTGSFYFRISRCHNVDDFDSILCRPHYLRVSFTKLWKWKWKNGATFISLKIIHITTMKNINENYKIIFMADCVCLNYKH